MRVSIIGCTLISYKNPVLSTWPCSHVSHVPVTYVFGKFGYYHFNSAFNEALASFDYVNNLNSKVYYSEQNWIWN